MAAILELTSGIFGALVRITSGQSTHETLWVKLDPRWGSVGQERIPNPYEMGCKMNRWRTSFSRSAQVCFGASVILLVPTSSVFADFSGFYSPQNWSENQTGATGFEGTVSASQSEIVITSPGSCGTSPTCYVEFTIQAPDTFADPTDNQMAFEWEYVSADTSPAFDQFKFSVDTGEGFELLTDSAGSLTQSGSVPNATFPAVVEPGDTIGFRIDSVIFFNPDPGDPPDPTATVTITNFSAPTAAFELTVSTTGDGTVTSDPAGIDCGADCSETYPDGTEVTLTETPNPGFAFDGWSGDCATAGTDTDATITMDADRTCGASFSPLTSLLSVTELAGATITSQPSGISCPDDCSEEFDEGSTVQLSVAPVPPDQRVVWQPAACADGQVTIPSEDLICTPSFQPVTPPTPIPAVSAWGLAALGGAMGLIGAFARRSTLSIRGQSKRGAR